MTFIPYSGVSVEIKREKMLLFEGLQPRDDRPSSYFRNGHYWALTDEMHNWLSDRSCTYELFVEPGTAQYLNTMRWKVWISDEKIGLLFKLTWA